MPVNKTKRENGYGEKLQVTVVTVDKEKRRVECATRDGAMIFAAVWETGTVFRWPEVGEIWTVRKDTGIWRMDALVQTGLAEVESEHVPTTLEELPEGATRITGEEVHMANVKSGDIFSGDVSSSGQITAADQSLVTHVDITPRIPLTTFSANSDEIWVSDSEYTSFDSVIPKVGQRVLLKEQINSVNGIYEVTQWETTKYTWSATPENFAAQPVSSTMKSAETYSNFTALPTIANEGNKAPAFGAYWSPESYSTVSGMAWKTPINPSGYGGLVQATVSTNAYSGAGRYISLWLNQPNLTERTGMRATIILTATNTYSVYIQRIVAGGVVSEVNAVNQVWGAPFTMQFAARSDGYWLFISNTGVLHSTDTTMVWQEGYAGIEGSGSNPQITNFKAGVFPGTGAVPYRSKWRMKRAPDDANVKTSQKVVVTGGEVRKNTEYQVKKVTGEEFEIEGWHKPTLLGSWEPYELGYGYPSYRKTPDGTVHLRGLVKAAAFGNPSPMTTLPVGYRPEFNVMFAVPMYWNNGSGYVYGIPRLDIQSNGEIILREASGTQIVYLSITCSWYADG